jgi:hypothetical protein
MAFYRSHESYVASRMQLYPMTECFDGRIGFTNRFFLGDLGRYFPFCPYILVTDCYLGKRFHYVLKIIAQIHYLS